MRYYLITIYLVVFALMANIYSQGKNVLPIIKHETVQQEKLDELTDKFDFGETKTVWKLKKSEHEPREIKTQPKMSSRGGGTGLNLVAYLLIFILIGAVIYMIFANVKFDKNIEDDALSNDHIEDIEEIDALDGFKKALMAGDYRSAIRMQFIKVLQLLQENNRINWRPEKTNKDYLRELRGTNEKSVFRKLSGIYELVWYGNTKIQRESFEQINPSFEKFIAEQDGK